MQPDDPRPEDTHATSETPDTTHVSPTEEANEHPSDLPAPESLDTPLVTKPHTRIDLPEVHKGGPELVGETTEPDGVPATAEVQGEPEHTAVETLPLDQPLPNEGISLETETPTAEGVDAPAESPDNEADEAAALQRQQESQIQAVVAQVLDNPETDYDTLLTQSSSQELVVLMEAISDREVTRESIRLVALTKKQFDGKYAEALTAVNSELERTAEVDQEGHESAKLEKNALSTYSRRFGQALLAYNKRRHKWEEQQAKEREVNAVIKREILESLRAIVHGEKVQAISQVRELQKRWRDTGPVPHSDFEDINESYRALLDQYYGLRAQFNELLEQDRKFNLEEKERLIAEMEALCETASDEDDAKVWQALADQVTALHEAWKNVGPIPREESEATWQRFKAATDQFYDLRRGFFETRDEQRAENTVLKQAILAELDSFIGFTATTQEAWHQASDAVQALQERWKLIGPATRDVGKQLFRTYRDQLNAFYKARAAFYEELNAARSGLVEQKEKLLAEVESLASNPPTENLQELSEKYKALQREWKKTGMDNYREARKLSKKFRKYCDRFFKQLKESFAEQHAAEEDNLNAKQALVEQLEALAAAPQLPEGQSLEDELKRIQTQWDEIGHVPFKQKDKIYARYRKALSHFLQQQEEDPKKREALLRQTKYLSLGAKDGGDQLLDRERRKLQAQVRKVEETIDQYENNILFISKGKSGDSLRAEIEGKIEEARKDLKRLKLEIKALREAKQS